MELNELQKKTSNATRWSSITEIAARCVSPITNMVLARLLTPEAFGVVATVTMITSFADLFTDAGFQKYLVQHDFKSRNDLDDSTNVAFWTNLSISVILWMIICSFSSQLAELVGNPGLGNVIVIASLSLPLTSFSSIQMARYKRDFEFKMLFYIRIVTILIPFLVTVPIAFITHSYWALIYGTLANNLVNAIILTWQSQWKPRFFYKVSLLKEMFSYSWWILLESIATWLTSYIGTFIVGKYLSTYYVGLYKTSMTTVNQIMSLVTTATSMPLFAALSRLKDNEAEMNRIYRYYIKAIGIFVIPLGVGIWMYRELVTDILLGSQWGEATEFVGLWGLMSSISLVLGTYCNGYFNAKGKTYLSFFAQILHLVVLIPILLISARSGYETLYIMRSLVRVELIFVEVLFMKVFMKFPVSKLFSDMIPAIFGTSVMFVINIFLQIVGDSSIWQFISAGICIIVYLGFMGIFYKSSLVNALEAFGIRRDEKEIEDKLIR